MIECLDKQRQHQLQLIDVNMIQQQSLSHNQPPDHHNQNPPPYVPPSQTNSIGLTASLYPQQQHYPQQPQLQHIQLLAQPQRAIIEVTNHQQSGNELIGYYFGSISRDTAEWILKTHGRNMDGAYLLRSSGPNDDFVLSLMVNHPAQTIVSSNNANLVQLSNLEVLHYKIVETEDSFVALHGQVGDEKFPTIDELIDKAQGVATKPRWPIRRQSLESQILPPTYWGLTVDQVRIAILIKAKQWGFPLLSSLFQHQDQVQQLTSLNVATAKTQHPHQVANPSIDENQANADINVTTLNNETIRTLIYKSLHEFQPWFHGRISRDEAERRIEEGTPRDGRFLVRERDNYSYAMCISHKKATKHYRIDVLPTGELAIQDGRKFTSLMALVSHYTIMSDGLWCALTEACPRPITSAKKGSCDKTLISGSVPLNDGTFVANSQVRVSPTNGICCNSNNGNPAAINQQGLYCIPPININHNSVIASNNVQNLVVPGSISNFSHENPSTNLNNYHSHAVGGINQTEITIANNSASKSHSNLNCSHQSGVVSLKTPIREWLQTINHKWSQLIASKNQHQSLNSFLFGNQNPLNNHCKVNHRDHANPMNYRHRKCKNGHISCACIRQQMLTNRMATTAQVNTEDSNTVQKRGQHLGKLNGIHTNQATTIGGYQEYLHGRVHDCCSSGTNIFRIAKSQQPSNLCTMPKNIVTQQQQQQSSFLENQPNNINLATTNNLLSHLPLNSGFSLSSQSFIGSPLFAVKQVQLEKNKSLVGTGSQASNTSGSENSHPAGEEKLISPVQSISGNLSNNPYNFDIYGSQTSTAIVNDRIPTSNSSSSSSGTIRLIQQALYSANTQTGQTQHGPQHAAKTANHITDRGTAPVNQTNSIQGGPILCGQHAGPAYRYTNCTDENNYKPCYHRPHLKCRAADDSHVATSSTELAGPSAMAKFVQFQDGQCLRTHRDTRSIQLAYLSSRPTNNGTSHQIRNSSQVPLRELNDHHQNNNSIPLATNSNASCSASRCSNSQFRTNNYIADVSGSNKLNHIATSRRSNAWNGCQGELAIENSAKTFGNEINLMDCGTDNNFDFKYDPKLIKSSSIETLCGFAGNEEENFDDLVNCKTNTELIMSLQSYWVASQLKPQQSKILTPVQTSNRSNTTLDQQTIDSSINSNRDVDGSNEGSILSSLVVDSKHSEQLDHMKKKHDLDELTTNLLSELTASLKAQVDLKNKQSGFNNNLPNLDKQDNQAQSGSCRQQEISSEASNEAQVTSEINPLELINEFDTLIHNNNR